MAMRKTLALSIVLLLAATMLFAHAGEVHTYMGTIAALRGHGAFVLKTTAGADVAVQTAASTTFTHEDGRAATAADLAAGMRVVVKISKDGKTAISVKMK
jgi:hypothetical protein